MPVVPWAWFGRCYWTHVDSEPIGMLMILLCSIVLENWSWYHISNHSRHRLWLKRLWFRSLNPQDGTAMVFGYVDYYKRPLETCFLTFHICKFSALLCLFSLLINLVYLGLMKHLGMRQQHNVARSKRVFSWSKLLYLPHSYWLIAAMEFLLGGAWGCWLHINR